MTLSTAGKNWLATNAGVNYCFSPTDVSFVDADGVPFTMGTKDVVIAFIGAHLVGKNDVIIIANTTYNGFKAINGSDLSYADATFVNNSDGHVGATLPLYCAPITGAYFTSTPTGASIFIDGSTTLSGTTPATIPNLTPGNHTYKLTYSGYIDATGSFTVVTDQVTNVDVTLVQTGEVFISSTPPGASIYIDNVIQVDITPATITGLAPGDYTYKLVLQGYRQATGPFTIISGQTTTVTEMLTIAPAEAGMGGLLIAGLAFGFLLLAKKKKKKEPEKGYPGLHQ